MSDLHDLLGVPPDGGGDRVLPLAIQPIGAQERSLLAPMIADGRFRETLARGLTTILEAPHAAPIRAVVGSGGLSAMAVLFGASSAWAATLQAGPAPCLHCGAPADPSDPAVGAAVLANYETTEAALAELDDARALSCLRCAALDPGSHGLAAAFLAFQVERSGGWVIDSGRSQLSQPETLSRAERRRQEKAAVKTGAKSGAKTAPCAEKQEAAVSDILAKAKDSVSMYRPFRVSLRADQVATVPDDCAVCWRSAGTSNRAIAVTPVNIVGLPLDGSASLVFRLCRPCSGLPDADVDAAVLDTPAARALGLEWMS